MGTINGRWLSRALFVAVALTSISGAAIAQAPKGAVDDKRLLAANDQTEDNNWINFGQDYRNQRFSSLTQINRDNVAKLQVAWIYQMGSLGSTQVQPTVVDGVIYFTAANNDVIAADAATGQEIWRYRHKFRAGSEGLSRAPRQRGVSVAYGKVFLTANDTRLVALDQATGKVVWDKQIAPFDPKSVPGLGRPGEPLPGPINFTLIAAPLLYDGLVIAGATGFESNDIGDAFVQDKVKAGRDPSLDWIQMNLGRRGFLFALDANTGNEVWRWYTTKQDGWEGNYVNVDPDGTPLNRDIKLEQQLAARYKDAWASGSTSVWMTPAVDAAAGLLFLGTANPAPGQPDLARPGDNLYANSVVALETKTGKLRWYMQETPHGYFDATGQVALIDATVNGQTVPAAVECGKSGWCYVMDRVTGKSLFRSEAVVRHMNTFAVPTPQGIMVAPGGGGGVGVSPVSYDPNSGYLYVAAIDRPEIQTLTKIPAVGGAPEQAYVKSQSVPMDQAYGTLTALDLRNKGKIVWQAKTKEPLVGGTVATAGGVVFTGEANGNFRAYDSKTGAQLWSFQTGANVGAPPITYSVAGRQYVAVATGAAAPADGQPIPAGALRSGGALMVFALPQ